MEGTREIRHPVRGLRSDERTLYPPISETAIRVLPHEIGDPAAKSRVETAIKLGMYILEPNS
ncbi:MAG TPA: hypothetical protein VJ646_03535 [Candidatus Binatia bacterium]|nr:hypothetical protein [Candidatus Binatia bacterium]